MATAPHILNSRGVHLLDPLSKNNCEQPKNVFYQRVITCQWKELILLGGVVLAVLSAVAAFFYGSALLATSFLILGSINAVGTFYMHQFSAFQNLQTTVISLRREGERILNAATTLERENRTLSQTQLNLLRNNQELQNTNESFRRSVEELQKQNKELLDTNQTLKQTNAALQVTNQELQKTNAALRHQVDELSFQIFQLKECSSLIKREVDLFQQGNKKFNKDLKDLKACTRALNEQLSSSETLCNIISSSMKDQQQGLAEKIDRLQVLFEELASQDSIKQRKEQLDLLREKIDISQQQLSNMQMKFIEERARMEEICKVLLVLRKDFNQVIENLKASNTDYRIENQAFHQTTEKLNQFFIALQKQFDQ